MEICQGSYLDNSSVDENIAINEELELNPDNEWSAVHTDIMEALWISLN